KDAVENAADDGDTERCADLKGGNHDPGSEAGMLRIEAADYRLDDRRHDRPEAQASTDQAGFQAPRKNVGDREHDNTEAENLESEAQRQGSDAEELHDVGRNERSDEEACGERQGG